MPADELAKFAAKDLSSATYETDRLLEWLYNLYVAVDSETIKIASQEITYLTSSDHAVVRVIALFNLSNPYFYRNDAFNAQYAAILGEQYPDTDLAQMALNFPLLKYRRSEAVAGELAKRSGKPAPYKRAPWSAGFQEHVEQAFDALEQGSDRAAAMAPLASAATDAPDWRERYMSLLMLEDQVKGGDGNQARPVAAVLAARNQQVTPEILRARILLARLHARALKQGGKGSSEDSNDCYQWAQSLLNTGVDVLTSERCLWEDRMKGIRNTARDLQAAGYLDRAEVLHTALAAEFPNSQVAADCATALGEIEATH